MKMNEKNVFLSQFDVDGTLISKIILRTSGGATLKLNSRCLLSVSCSLLRLFLFTTAPMNVDVEMKIFYFCVCQSELSPAFRLAFWRFSYSSFRTLASRPSSTMSLVVWAHLIYKIANKIATPWDGMKEKHHSETW